MHYRSALATLTLLTSACGVVVQSPADVVSQDTVGEVSAPDVVQDTRSQDAVTPDALGSATDASVDSEIAADGGAQDASRSASGVFSRGEEICGVSTLYALNAGVFAVLYGTRDRGMGRVHFATVSSEGNVLGETVIASGPDESMCVARGALVEFEGGDFLAAWHRRAGTQIEVARLTARGTIIALGSDLSAERDRTAFAMSPETLTLRHRGGIAFVDFETHVRGVASLERLEFNFNRPTGGGPSEPARAGINRRATVTLELATESPWVLAAEPSSDGLVIATHRNNGDGSGVIELQSLSAIDMVSPRVRVNVPEPQPVVASMRAHGDALELLYTSGYRDRSLHVLQLNRALATVSRLDLAENTTWHRVAGLVETSGLNTLWTSHGLGGGFNNHVLLAPRTERDPLRCSVLTSDNERAEFLQVAHARRASRQQLVVAIARVPVAATSESQLHVRWLEDGASACR